VCEKEGERNGEKRERVRRGKKEKEKVKKSGSE
jgi:hypothetical protein